MAEGKVIETPRLRIEPFPETYLGSRYVSWLNDPEVVRYSEQRHKRHTLESCRHYWQSFQDSPHFFWAITAVDGDFGHIGNLNAYIDAYNLTASVGILIGERRVWGKGYGLEAWTAVCHHLIKAMGLRKVTAGTLALNKGMLKIMEKSGMVPDGRWQRHYLVEGEEVDIIFAALFRDEEQGLCRY
jgi:[ribosomal protein S5]-alanine N-acetyltransferase